MSANKISRSTRRLLFPEPLPSGQNIPGAGDSAAGGAQRHTKVKITINLDGEVVSYFKEQAKIEGRAYQSLINQILREYIAGNRLDIMKEELIDNLLKDEHFLDQLSAKLLDRSSKIESSQSEDK